MPYRRLPNTDQARLRAIKLAIEKGKAQPIDKLAFPPAFLSRAKTFYPGFESAVIQLKQAKKQQSKNSRTYNTNFKRARLYVSHFIQVLNFCIARGEMKPAVREFYGMNPKMKKTPSLLLESQVLEWGKKIIDGEQQRTLHGGNAIYNPSIAVVRVKYDQFVDSYHFQKTLQNNTARASEKVAKMREEADHIILNIWNEVERYFADFPEEIRRRLSEEYGVVYFYRPSEKKKLEAQRLQTNIDFSAKLTG